MKLLLALIFMTSVSFAAEEVVVVDVSEIEFLSETRFADSEEAKFAINFQTNEVMGELSFYDEIQLCTGSTSTSMGNCTTIVRLLKKISNKIEGLFLIENKVIFYSRNGQIECGRVKSGRIFRNSKLVLNGKCELSSRVVSVQGEKRFQFVFRVK